VSLRAPQISREGTRNWTPGFAMRNKSLMGLGAIKLNLIIFSASKILIETRLAIKNTLVAFTVNITISYPQQYIRKITQINILKLLM
jgi:hypothetical protein